MSVLAGIYKIPELRKRIIYTLSMLAVYRIGIFVTTPGVDRNAMRDIVADGQMGFLGMLNLFSGGALEQLSIFALNIMPYVSASIIISLLQVMVKPLEELRKEGEAGQRKINQYTRYGTIALSVVQGMMIAQFLESLNAQGGARVVTDPGWSFRLMTILTLTTGTAFLMWLGEQINEKGIGNGISLIIFAGIVANLPDAVMQTSQLVRTEQIMPIDLMNIGFLGGLVIALIVFFERAQRKLPITYSKRIVGRNVYGGESSHLPLKVNMAGVIPPIFASSLLLFPATLSNWDIPGMRWLQAQLDPGAWPYLVVFAVLSIFFSFFYTAITVQPVDMAENLKKQNAFIPGIRPGKATAEYIDTVITRLTTVGAIYVAAVCTVPAIFQNQWRVPFYFGGTSLMIVVSVALDLAQQVDAHLITRHYEGLAASRGPRIRERNA